MVTIGGKLKVGFILFMVSTAATAALQGQDLRLVDPTSSAADLKPGAVERLPLEPAQRAAVRQAIKARDYPRAETILVDEINKNPKAPQLLTFLGSLFFLDGKYLNTAIAMKKAEAIEPLDDRNRFTLALSYIILNQCDWARPELEKLARANPREPLYPYWLGRLDFDAQQFKAAAANLRKALELDPTFMKAYDNLGLTYEVLAQYDDAIRI
jgi:tetratricopeptide (TPR) repeat protein